MSRAWIQIHCSCGKQFGVRASAPTGSCPNCFVEYAITATGGYNRMDTTGENAEAEIERNELDEEEADHVLDTVDFIERNS